MNAPIRELRAMDAPAGRDLDEASAVPARPGATGADAAFAACEEITRRRARNFWYGLRLTPEPARSAMYAVYAWMRQADDLADEGAAATTGVGAAFEDAPQRRARIEALRDRTVRLFGLDVPCTANDDETIDPVWVAMRAVVRRYRLDPQPFLDMIKGQLEDVEGREYRTFDDLRKFCERVASTVGIVCIEIWGYSDPRAPALAIDRGIAFQLTNILRDFREDRERGRVYLPTDELHAHGIDADALLRWEPPDRCRAFVQFQVERAAEFYRRSAELDRMISPECLPTLWAMTAIYRGLLDRIGGRPFRIVGRRRIRLSSITKIFIAIRARRMGAVARRRRPSAAAEPAP